MLNVNKDVILMPQGCNWRWHWVETLIKENDWSTGCELGVKEGRFTNHLLSTCDGLHMTCVDLWDSQPNNTRVGGETYESWDNESFYTIFNDEMKRTFSGRYVIHRMFTDEAIDLVDDNSLDFVFIDADHSFEGVSGDIDKWKHKVKDSGAILGHDYSWPTVQDALTEQFCDQSKIFRGYNNCWGIMKTYA